MLAVWRLRSPQKILPSETLRGGRQGLRITVREIVNKGPPESSSHPLEPHGDNSPRAEDCTRNKLSSGQEYRGVLRLPDMTSPQYCPRILESAYYADSIRRDTTYLGHGGANIGAERATNLDVRRKYQRRILPWLGFMPAHNMTINFKREILQLL